MPMFSNNNSYELLPRSIRTRWENRDTHNTTFIKIRNTILVLIALALYSIVIVFIFRNGPPSYSSPLLSTKFACHDTVSCLQHFPDNTTLPPPIKVPSQNISSDSRKYAFVSALYTSGYLRAALALGYSIRKHHQNQNYPMYLFHLDTSHFTPIELCQLKLVGWILIQVPSIPAPPGTPKNFKDNFAKFNLWGLTDFDAVMYLDADMLVLRPMDKAFQFVDEKFSPFEFAAAMDNYGGITQDFNAGMMVLRPSLPIYGEIMRLYKIDDIYPAQYAEQSFLNEFFRMRFLRLPDIWNLNVAFFRAFPSAWKEVVGDAKLIHFTITKPMVQGRDADCRDDKWKGVCGIWEIGWEEMAVNLDLGNKCQI